MSECARADGRCPFATICTGRCYHEKSRARHAAAERRKAVRTCPLPTFPSEGRPENWCRWCGGEIVHGRVKQRGWHDGREDEPNCAYEWRLHTRLEAQYPFLVERDGEKCADCGGKPEGWRRGEEVGVYISEHLIASARDSHSTRYVGRYCEVTWVVSLEVDHDVPLWSIAHLPDDERRPFFGPPNLKLRCDPCHAAKTAGEAGTRAKGNRQSKMRLDVPRPEPTLRSRGNFPGHGKGPGIASRPFAAGKRPLRSRNDLKRR